MPYDDLIYDLGANNGRDTEFYLLKGFRVLAVEANVTLYLDLRERFSSAIARGDLILLNIGVWSQPSLLTFYVNLDNDHWSSFDPAYGCRQGTRFETIEVECLTVKELVRRFGMPHYMKIDVEGADKFILSDLLTAPEPPNCISVEEYGVGCIDVLRELGYRNFKFIEQCNKSAMVPPKPPAEGLFVPRDFNSTDSGLFGKELPGEWMPYGPARDYFLTHIRNEQSEWLAAPNEWYDVHASL